MATMIPVNKRQVKQCNRCPGWITFVKNRNGKWFPVDVFTLPSREWVYRTGIGAYGNLTPWHRCNLTPQQEEKPAEVQPVDPQAERKAQLCARYAELLNTGMPKPELWNILNAEFADLG